MNPAVRKLALTTHVTVSVGWLGAVAAFLALAVAGLTTGNAQRLQAVYPAMQLLTWYLIVPLSLASLATGLIQSLGTSWGLFRHYWVVTKLALNLGATLLLLLHTRPIDALADAAARGVVGLGEYAGVRVRVASDASLALMVLLAAITLSVYKPQGLTAYGRRKVNAQAEREGRSRSAWNRALGVVAVLMLAVIIIMHLHGGFHHSREESEPAAAKKSPRNAQTDSTNSALKSGQLSSRSRTSGHLAWPAGSPR